MKHEQVATKWRIANVSGTREHEVWSVPYQQLRAKDLLTLTSYKSDRPEKKNKGRGPVDEMDQYLFSKDNKIEDNDSEKIKSVEENLICPRCGKQLVLRTAKKGTNVGKQFYGCSGFSTCRYIRNV